MTSIGNSAFSSCISLTSITIPSSVTNIGIRAFSYCIRLTSITIPSSVTSIGGSAFYSCSNLTSIEIPDSVTSVEAMAFGGCRSLTRITIPSSVTSIGNCAFLSCGSLASVTIFSKDVTIYDYAGTISATATIYGYSGSTAEAYATKYNRKFVAIRNIIASGTCGAAGDNLTWSLDDEGLLTIEGSGAMKDYLPSETVSWEDYLSSIKSVEIGNGVTSIGKYAFEHCSKLTSIEIPSSVTSIGDYAFYNCSSLTSITIPSGVIIIGSRAFYGCSKLKYNEYDNAKYLGNAENPYHALIEAKNTSITDCTINDSTKVIGGDAFRYCGSLTGITIPSSVIIIGSGAFYGCSILRSITIYSNDVTIYDSADTISNTATIYGYKGSTAEAYAKKYNRKFIPLECDEHNFGDNYKHDDINHWLECSVCGKKADVTEHSFEQQHNETTHWSECACGYKKGTATHKFTRNHDEKTHWLECSVCHAKKDIAAHTFDNACDTTCDICGYTRSISHN